MRRRAIAKSKLGRSVASPDSSAVPTRFRTLLPLARKWAISDDSERCELLEQASVQSRRQMVSAVLPHFNALEHWCTRQFLRRGGSREAVQLNLLCTAATESMFDVYPIS